MPHERRTDAVLPPDRLASRHRAVQEPLPQVLLLDLDDTIVRFTAGQPDFWRLACERFLPRGTNLEEVLENVREATSDFWDDDERAFWGRQNMVQARRIIARRGLVEHGLTAFAEAIADHMTHSKEQHVRPFPRAIETLVSLRRQGHRLGLLTNGSSEFQRRKLHRYDLTQYFELVLIEGELGYGKPDTHVFERALSHFRVRASDTLMIGDNLVADIAGAQGAGIAGIWCDAHGAGMPQTPPAQPRSIIGTISELVVGNRTPLERPAPLARSPR